MSYIVDNLRQLHSTHPDVGLTAAAQGAWQFIQFVLHPTPFCTPYTTNHLMIFIYTYSQIHHYNSNIIVLLAILGGFFFYIIKSVLYLFNAYQVSNVSHASIIFFFMSWFISCK